jgi:uncharacterized protein YecT (DUF1311 family)
MAGTARDITSRAVPVQLDKQQLSALARLSRSPDGQMLLVVVRSWLTDADKKCRRLEGAALHQAQGDAQRCEALVALLEHEAVERIEELETQHFGTRRLMPIRKP